LWICSIKCHHLHLSMLLKYKAQNRKVDTDTVSFIVVIIIIVLMSDKKVKKINDIKF
jgi:hypothetical protein